MIKVLVVEDSPVVRELLVHILSSDPEIIIDGTANNGEEAVEYVKRKKPDVITMDINMPKMNGFEATRKIMEANPAPTVIVSGNWDTQEMATTFLAIEAGALAAVPRPRGIGHPDYEDTAAELVRTVKLMSEVKVVRRWARPRPEKGASAASAEVKIGRAPAEVRLVAIGASTGGPTALQAILSGLPRNFPAPVLIVQHMATGFIPGFVEWLGQSSGLPVRVATHGELPLPGQAYVAPDGLQMRIEGGPRLVLGPDEPENGLRPSISYLFRAVARVFGENAVGILLTGMGRDGAEELKLMRERGALTIAQDQETSVVHGMPGEAIRIGAATQVLPLGKIAAVLIRLVNQK